MQKFIVQLTTSQGDVSFNIKTYFVIAENEKKAINRAFRELHINDTKFIIRLAQNQIKFVCSLAIDYTCNVCKLEGCLIDQNMPVKLIQCRNFLDRQKWLETDSVIIDRFTKKFIGY